MKVEEAFATVDENLRKIGVRYSEVLEPGVEPSFLDALETYLESPLPQGLREWNTHCGGPKLSLGERVEMLNAEILCPYGSDLIEGDMKTYVGNPGVIYPLLCQDGVLQSWKMGAVGSMLV